MDQPDHLSAYCEPETWFGIQGEFPPVHANVTVVDGVGA